MTTVVCNSGPLMALGKLNRLRLFQQLYGEVHITAEVYQETVEAGISEGFPDAVAIKLFWEQQGWPVITVTSEQWVGFVPTVILDSGEMETIGYALSLPSALVLLDDEQARQEARRQGLAVHGTLGILVEAYRRGFLTYPEAELLLLQIAVRPDIWISAKLCHRVLSQLQGDIS